jgi:CBS domain-containing protein
MLVKEVMTRDVAVVAPTETIQRAARLMDDLNVGSLPVCDGRRIVGMITDRDITVRAVALGRAPAETRVADAMSEDVRWCYEDTELREAVAAMQEVQIRRIPIIDHDRNLVGIVALGDVATKIDDRELPAEVLKRVSEPSRPDR